MTNYYVPGTTNTICDITGFKVKRSECRKTWDGLVVIDEAWDPRQPQDFAPTIRERTVITDARQRPSDDVPSDTFEVV